MTPTPPPAMSLLWSYVYARTYQMDQFLGELPVPRVRFFADSGAHSARTLGLDLQVDDYGAWLTQWSRWMTVYANLDVIWAPQATWENQRRLEDHHGLHPTPVFHTGEPWHWLERYLDAGYTYIALGKLLGVPQAKLRPWLARAFAMAEGRAVFHGFGLTVWPLLREFPFHSVDSSSWGGGVRYGNLRLFHRGEWVSVMQRDRAQVLEHRRVLDSYGLKAHQLSRDGYDRSAVAGACAVACYRAADWLRDHHGPNALPPGKGYPPPGTPTAAKVVPALGDGGHVYLADGSTSAHQWHADGLHTYLADTGPHHHRNHADGLHTYLAATQPTHHHPHAVGLHMYLADASRKWTSAAAGGIAQETPA